MAGLLDHGSLRLVDLLSEAANRAIAAAERRVTYEDGRMIFASGDADQRLLIVRSGAVKMGRVGADGRETILAVLGPGHFIGLVGAMVGRVRGQNAVAVGDTTVGYLDKAEFFALMDIHPEIARAALPAALSRLSAALNFIDDVRRLPLTVHTAVLVQSMLKASGEDGVIRWNQSDIALAAGASRVSVGKALKRLENAGFIRQKYGVIEVCDPKGLANWIDAARAAHMPD